MLHSLKHFLEQNRSDSSSSKMCTLMLGSLFVTSVQLPFTNALDSCDFEVFPLHIGKCEEVTGGIINCTYQVLELLELIQHLQELYYNSFVFWENLSVYDEIKLYNTIFTRQLLALKNVSNLINKTYSQYAAGSYCVNQLQLDHLPDLLCEVPVPILAWLEYYFPIIGGVELIFGMLVNMMIVMIYIRQQDMRTAPNMIIVNLAVGDMLLLIINIVIYYISYRWIPQDEVHIFCPVITYFRTVAIAISVNSMVVLSVLRLLATISTPGSRTQHWMGKHGRVPLILLLVWGLAGVTGIPEYIFYDSKNICEFSDKSLAVYLRFVFLCLLPLFVIGCSSVATSTILRRSVHQLPGELTPEVLRERHARQTGTKVIICLVMVFSITYIPLNIYFVLNFYYSYHPEWNYYFDSATSAYYYIIMVQLFIPLNSCLNPVALFIGSRKYRQYFKHYFSKCVRKEAQNVANGQQGTELQVAGSVASYQRSTSYQTESV